MGDKAPFNFTAKFHSQFVISHVKSLKCQGNAASKWRPNFKKLARKTTVGKTNKKSSVHALLEKLSQTLRRSC